MAETSSTVGSYVRSHRILIILVVTRLSWNVNQVFNSVSTGNQYLDNDKKFEVNHQLNISFGLTLTLVESHSKVSMANSILYNHEIR